MREARELIHGTCVALGPHAALIRGRSGSGKSDLALRFLALPPEHGLEPLLVADDQVWVERQKDGSLVASAPSNLAGKIEVRGLGILEVPHRGEARARPCRRPRFAPGGAAHATRSARANHHRGDRDSGCKTCAFRTFRGAQAQIGASFGSIPIASSTGIGSGLRVIAVATKIAAFNRADQICGAT